MSVYTDQGEAARMLLDDWTLRRSTTGVDGVFTELDVIFLAAREATFRGEPYTPGQMLTANREASQVMGSLFRTHQVVRFGPVYLPESKSPDYARIATKIVYAHPEGLEVLQTPNGDFKRLFVHEDPIAKRQGKRAGSNRDDLTPWEAQGVLGKRPIERPVSADQREILRLRTELAAAHEQMERLTAENHRLREHSAQSLTEDRVRELIAESRPKRQRRAA